MPPFQFPLRVVSRSNFQTCHPMGSRASHHLRQLCSLFSSVKGNNVTLWGRLDNVSTLFGIWQVSLNGNNSCHPVAFSSWSFSLPLSYHLNLLASVDMIPMSLMEICGCNPNFTPLLPFLPNIVKAPVLSKAIWHQFTRPGGQS